MKKEKCKHLIDKEFKVKDRTGSGEDYTITDKFCTYTNLRVNKSKCKSCNIPKNE